MKAKQFTAGSKRKPRTHYQARQSLLLLFSTTAENTRVVSKNPE